MSEIVIIKKSNLSNKSSVYGSYEYGCNFCIAPKNEQLLRKRGYHMTDNEIKDMLYNLPKEFKPFVRFIKDEKDAKHYEEKKIKKVKEVIEAVKEMKAEVESEIYKEIKEETKEVVKEVIASILDVDYSEFDEKQLYEHKLELKAYAKEQGIKIHPALKDIEKIIKKIKG